MKSLDRSIRTCSTPSPLDELIPKLDTKLSDLRDILL